MTIVLSLCALALTTKAALLPEAGGINVPQAPHVGALTLLGLIGATVWLVRTSSGQLRAQAWAKAALTLSLTLPAIWLFRERSIIQELSGMPDADLPAGWLDRVNGDLHQTQLVALTVTVALIVCATVSGLSRTEPALHH
jgi:formate hydrogenlyase subunit 3/multisubunit Na+/H+ antiporter MnhD subunit